MSKAVFFSSIGGFDGLATSFFSFFNFYTLRTAAFDAQLTGVLYILAIPYQYTQYIFNIIFWSLIIFYMKKNFKAKNVPIDEKHIEKVIFSSITEFPTYDEYAKVKTNYLVTRRENVKLEDIEQEREEVSARHAVPCRAPLPG